MLRGSGIKGLGGIAPKRSDGVIRPLLCISKAEVEEFLQSRGQDFVTDSTNSDTDMTRNFIRLNILPLVRSINPAADKALSRLSDSAREDEEYFVEEAKKLPKNAPLSYLKAVPTPILKRYLSLRYGELMGVHARLDYDSLAAICDGIKKGEGHFRYSVSGDIAVIGDKDSLEFIKDKIEPIPFCFTVAAAGEYEIPQGKVFVTESETEIKSIIKEKGGSFIAYPVTGEAWQITVRSAREGDRYLRGKMHRAVRKELNAIGYPAHKRASHPRFCDGDGIFWIPKLPTSDKLKKAAIEKFKQIIYIGYTEN